MTKHGKMLVSSTHVAMAALISQTLETEGVTQAELARQAGVTEKHVSRVLSNQAGTQIGQLDYWAWLLGMRFEVTLVRTPT